MLAPLPELGRGVPEDVERDARLAAVVGVCDDMVPPSQRDEEGVACPQMRHLHPHPAERALRQQPRLKSS